MTWIPNVGSAVGPIVAVLLSAALLSVWLTPVVRAVVLRYEIVDRPGGRRINTTAVPRAGGIAVCAAFLIVATVFLVLNQVAAFVSVPFTLEPTDVIALLVGGALATALGAIDDLLDLRARYQLLGQVALACGAVALGITIDFVTNPIGSGELLRFSGPIAAGLTIFWIVGMINSINWIDGLDGLSSGVAFIAAVTLGLISLTTPDDQVGQPLIAVLCFALAGALLGFLRWNFHPATIFAGTSGVQFVGYTLAVLAILGTAKVAVALLVLGVPIIDTFWIIVRRAVAAALTVQPRPHAHPSSPARSRPDPSADRPRDLRHLPWVGRALPAALGRHAAVRVPRRVRRLRAGPVPADARRLRSPRRARGRGLRAQPRAEGTRPVGRSTNWAVRQRSASIAPEPARESAPRPTGKP